MSSAEVRFRELRADFGKTASDYGRHRAGFPDEFFERLAAIGNPASGMRALDLGNRHRDDRARAGAQRMRSYRARSIGAADGASGGAGSRGGRASSSTSKLLLRRPACRRRVRTRDRWSVLALVRSSARGGGSAPSAEAGRQDRHRAFRLDSAAGQHDRGDREADREAQSEMEVRRRSGNPSAVAARYCDRGIQKYRNVFVRPRRHLHARGVARADSRECGSGREPCARAVAAFDDELRAMLAERWPEDPMPVMHRVFAAIGVAP